MMMIGAKSGEVIQTGLGRDAKGRRRKACGAGL
jgi:hypothetical protein